VNPFGTTARAIELEGDHLLVTKRGLRASVSFPDICEAACLRKGALGTTLSLQSSEQSNVILRGAGHADARAFADRVKAAWVSFNTGALDREAHRFDRLHDAIFGLARPGRYPAACSLAQLLQDARFLDASLLSKLKAEAIGADRAKRVALVRKFVADPRAARAIGGRSCSFVERRQRAGGLSIGDRRRSSVGIGLARRGDVPECRGTARDVCCDDAGAAHPAFAGR